MKLSDYFAVAFLIVLVIKLNAGALPIIGGTPDRIVIVEDTAARTVAEANLWTELRTDAALNEAVDLLIVDKNQQAAELKALTDAAGELPFMFVVDANNKILWSGPCPKDVNAIKGRVGL